MDSRSDCHYTRLGINAIIDDADVRPVARGVVLAVHRVCLAGRRVSSRPSADRGRMNRKATKHGMRNYCGKCLSDAALLKKGGFKILDVKVKISFTIKYPGGKKPRISYRVMEVPLLIERLTQWASA